MAETVSIDRRSVAKPVSRAIQKARDRQRVGIDRSRTCIGKLEAEGVLRRASDGSGFGVELAPGIAAIGRLQSVTPPSSTTITRKNPNQSIDPLSSRSGRKCARQGNN